MDRNRGSDVEAGSSHIVEYDATAPSSVFSRKQIDYVESINEFMSADEVRTVRGVEWFIYNKNSDMFGYSFVPGLRGEKSIRGSDAGALYVKRYSAASYPEMMDKIMAHVPRDFPKTGSGGNMPGYRVTIPSGDRFYPIVFFGDLGAWRRRLQESADLHQTQLAHFDQGKFVVSDGKTFDFGELRVELLESRKYPKSW